MLACPSTEQWVETSASVPTMPPKWVCFYTSLCKHCATVYNILIAWNLFKKAMVRCKFVFCFLCSACHSNVGWNGIRLSACHGRTATPNRAGPVCYLVCCSGWIGCVVSDVILPSPCRSAAVRERAEKHRRKDSKERIPSNCGPFPSLMQTF